MAKVKLENIYKVYEGGVRAVNDFNLDIPDKEFVVFVGPSGCGKSTTLRMIAGLEDITQGKLYIDDQVVNDVESKNRDIAMVFQNYALYPHMTVYQNMAFGLKLRHTPKAEIDERVKKAAEILEISELLSRKPKALSGGQRQRVALGRAIVREPKVFLLDEPLSNLDAKLRVQMRSEITKLHQNLKTTFIYVTHDQTEAMTMGTRIVVMKDGFIQQVDSPVSLFEEPANLFVATFLGSPQMNIVDATLSLEKGKLVATLENTVNNVKVTFSDLKRKELISDKYLGKSVKFGIRPEAISVDPNGTIEAIINVVEQLGDETILYCTIEGINKDIVIKTPFKGHVNIKEKVMLSFNMEKVHLFDSESNNSILGMRLFNDYKVVLDNDEIVLGKNRIRMVNGYKEHILPSAFGKEVVLRTEVSKMSVDELPNSIKLPIKVDFTEQRTDYISAYYKVEGLDEYFALKLKNDTEEMPKFVYIPFSSISILDENGDYLNSREIIYPNIFNGKLVKNGNDYYVNIPGAKLHVDGDFDTLGNVEVEIDPEGVEVVFNKQLNKQNKEHNLNIEMRNLISFSAYDEYKSKNKNFIYGLVPGLKDYATFVVNNDFSVYKMPKFKIHIPEKCIKIKY